MYCNCCPKRSTTNVPAAALEPGQFSQHISRAASAPVAASACSRCHTVNIALISHTAPELCLDEDAMPVMPRPLGSLTWPPVPVPVPVALAFQSDQAVGIGLRRCRQGRGHLNKLSTWPITWADACNRNLLLQLLAF